MMNRLSTRYTATTLLILSLPQTSGLFTPPPPGFWPASHLLEYRIRLKSIWSELVQIRALKHQFIFLLWY